MSREERTASQKAWQLVAEFRKRWFRIGTCTDPADRPRAEAVIARMYAEVGAASPRFFWCDSPLTAQVALYLLGRRRTSRQNALRLLLQPSQRDELEAIRQAPLGVWMGDRLQASVQEKLKASLRDVWMKDTPSTPGRSVLLTAAAASLRSLWTWGEPNPWRSVLPMAVAEVRRSRWGSLLACELLQSPLERTLQRSLRRFKVPYRETSLRGQQEGVWIEGLLFFRDVLGVRYAPHLSERLDWWADLARSCLWWWPYSGICVVGDRPAEIHTLDEEGLHNDSGPAVRFRDGWSIWAIGGIVVDEQVVLQPDTQTLQQIRRERNAEVQRIRIERYGWDRYLAEVGAVVIDRRRNDVEATRETLMRTPGGNRLLVCACPSTARVYALAVPRNVRTCERAQAWLSGGLAGRIINGA